ncbi:MAG: type IX secretion system sortase PorU [Flavobacterium sp.]|nr:type IX secretion system sortase PorU [Flavobacterium sp.]
MKNFAILFFLVLCIFSNAQVTKSYDLKWDAAKIYQNEDFIFKYPTFEGLSFSIDNDLKQLFFKDVFNSSTFLDNASLQVKNVSYQIISTADLFDLDKSKIPTAINARIESTIARSQIVTSFTFNPIIKEGNTYKKVTSISFTCNALNASQSRVSSGNQTFSTVNSVLASGTWFKFYVEKSGVYRISRQFLQSLGMNVNVDPRTIKIYGNGGRMLPLSNAIDAPIDPIENPIRFIGESDGVFNDSDFILFYAEGVDVWNQESLTSVNLFSDKSYYYVTASPGLGKRIPEAVQPSLSSSLTFTDYDDTFTYEKDLVNVGKVGRRWFGEQFIVNRLQTFEFDFPNLVTAQPIGVKINLASRSLATSSFQVRANNQVIGNVSFLAIAPNGGVQGYENALNTTLNTTTTAITFSLEYNNGGVPSSNGYLDFIQLKMKRNLRGFGKQFHFYNEQQENNIGVGEYNFTNASAISEVWDVTDLFNVERFPNNNQATFSFKVPLGIRKKYVAIDAADYFLPLRESNATVVNQNLKGTIFNNNSGAFQDIDYLIITPFSLRNQAETLANFHKNNNGLSVKVVTTESIYNEFSTGKQDIAAIRNFIKYVYWNASTAENRVRYVNLFGDASYDYKNRIPNNSNIVPIFHGFNPNASESNNTSNMSLFSSFMSDDFFGLMDDNEGQMLSGVDGIDIAVGRMLVDSPQQAQEMVNKVLEYHEAPSYGRWRNNYVIYSDDADDLTDSGLQFRLDDLADNLVAEKPFVNVKKIHTDSYLQQVAAGGDRYPQAKAEFLNALDLGALVFNYFGHGNEEFLARERLFERLDAQNLRNRYRYPLFITITCEFTRFDDPGRPTGGEFMYWNKEGGAIALVATTRQIGVSTGLIMNNYLSEQLYAFGSFEYPTIAEALRRAKLLPGTSDNRRVISFIGDPAMKLAIPKQKVVLTAVNDVPISQPLPVFQALSLMKISGQVVDENDNLIPNYNGDLAIQIFDKDIERTTLANDFVAAPGPGGISIMGNFFSAGQLIRMNFVTLGEAIFRGNASVNNGLFELSFVVPQDIRIPVGNGKISFYAKKTGNQLEDQTGFDRTIQIGGVNVNAPTDNTPPRVQLYMNDESFVSGGITNCSPILLAFLQDENGINTASGIGHDIVAILDGDEANPYVLNDYYETENDDFTRGRVRFPFRDLSPGMHTILFKAWDVYNNLVTAEIQFNAVCTDEGLRLERVLNYPNPFVSYTEFWFNHNRPFEPLDVQVQILTVTGKVVKTINQQVVTDGFLCREITWDGRDDFGDKIGKGVYVYKLTVRSTLSGSKAEKYEKLVIL